MGRIARGQEATGIMHHPQAHGDVADRRAVIDQRLRLPLVVPGIHIGDAYFHFERGGDAIHGFVAVVLGILAVRVEIDGARGDYEAGGIDCGAALEREAGGGLDFAAGDDEVAHCAEAALRIEYAAVAYEQVLRLFAERRKQREEPGSAHAGLSGRRARAWDGWQPPPRP